MPIEAVVFDLFGTLVAAPTSAERADAAAHLASVVGCERTAVDHYLRDTWQIRHDGTLPTVTDLAEHLVRAMAGPSHAVGSVADTLHTIGCARLAPDPSVSSALTLLRAKRLRIGILSDASVEVASCWPASLLATLMHANILSCQAGTVKPAAQLYHRILRDLNASAECTLYVGDGGGDELNGALAIGMHAVAVRRRGPMSTLVFGDTAWAGAVLDSMEQVPAYLTELT